MAQKSGKDCIEVDGEAAHCRICFDAFRTITPTIRWCSKCGNAFCEGKHGNFAYGHGSCVICGSRKSYLSTPWSRFTNCFKD